MRISVAMRSSAYLPMVLLCAAGALLASCSSKPRETAVTTSPVARVLPVAPADESAEPTTESGAPLPCGAAVKVVAYINAQSMVHQPTVTLLEDLVARHGGLVSLEIIDFATEEGAAKLKEAGLDSETIRIDGSEFVKFKRGDETVVVQFRGPVGFVWDYEDLVDAVQAAVDGTLETATEEEAVAARPLPVVEPKIEVRETVGPDGEAGAEIRVEGFLVANLVRPHAGRAPMERAEAARSALGRALAEPYDTKSLKTAEVGETSVVRIGETDILALTDDDARVLGLDRSEAAKEALEGIRRGIAMAVRPDTVPLSGGPVPAAAAMGATRPAAPT